MEGGCAGNGMTSFFDSKILFYEVIKCFPERLRALRQGKGLSLPELASALKPIISGLSA